MTMSQSSDFSCNTPPLNDTLPALFTRMPRPPSSLSTLLSAGSNPARLVTSTLTAIEGTPIAFSSESTRWFFSSFRPNTATAAPASANPSAMLRPIPPLPPVTTAIRPVRSNNAGAFIKYSPCRVFGVAAQLLMRRPGYARLKPELQVVYRCGDPEIVTTSSVSNNFRLVSTSVIHSLSGPSSGRLGRLAPMPLSAGDKLGPYQILAPIRAGRMGEVYRAKDPRLNRDVAIKVSASQFSERFEREAKAIAALNHPNICQIYDIGPNYLVMEFIEGTPLHGPLPLDRALRYAVQICDALDAAHKKSITHRDLKPGNILATASGVKLLDFGLAKMGTASATAASDAATRTMYLTEVGTVLGTAAYMSPEQAKGEPMDARSDIFSFGLVLYEMLG